MPVVEHPRIALGLGDGGYAVEGPTAPIADQDSRQRVDPMLP